MTGQPSTVVVTASLDNLTSRDVRFLQEAARFGPLHVRVPSDAMFERRAGCVPRFPAAERRFLAASLRCVNTVSIVNREAAEALPDLARRFGTLVVPEAEADAPAAHVWTARGRALRAIRDADLEDFPGWETDAAVVKAPAPGDPARTIVTGCFDWLHSGHIRFFMDAAAVGELYVVVGSDRNVALLKGPEHPLQHEDERRYMVGAVRSVHRCIVSTGSGWMDAEPEVGLILPHYYVVNEDGDQPSKREFCALRGIEYVVLRRLPHKGLPARSSTALRGY